LTIKNLLALGAPLIKLSDNSLNGNITINRARLDQLYNVTLLNSQLNRITVKIVSASFNMLDLSNDLAGKIGFISTGPSSSIQLEGCIAKNLFLSKSFAFILSGL
jgi:hypothetical protein